MVVVTRIAPRPTAQLVAWITLAVVAGWGSVVDPRVAVGVLALAIALLVPFEALAVATLIAAALQAVSVPVSGIDVPIAVPLGVLLAVRGLARPGRHRLRGTEFAAIAFVSLLGVTSLLHAGDPIAALRTTALLAAGAAAFVGLSVGVRDRVEAIALLRALLVVGAANAAVGLLAVAAYVATGSTWGITLLDQPAGFPAATGIAFEHNFFGSTCAVMAVALLGLWRVTNPIVSSRWAVRGFWLCTAGVVASLTRGAWVGFAVGVIVVVMLTRRDAGRRPVGRLVIGAAALMLAVAALAFVVGRGPQVATLAAEGLGSIGEQGAKTFEFDRGTGYLRATEWRAALEDVSASPLFGYGTNTFGERHVDQTLRGPQPSFLGNWAVRAVHDGGIVGFVLFAGFLASVVWPGRRTRSASGVDAATARVLCAAGATMVVAYLAADAFLLVWPWAILGTVRAFRRVAEDAPA